MPVLTYILAAVVAVILILGFYIVLPAIVKVGLRSRFLRALEGTDKAVLTFDDGPDPEVTPKLIDLLDAAGVKATFFVVGEKAKAHPELIKRMISSGHEIGEHSNYHYYPWASGPIRATIDLWGCARVLNELELDKNNRLFRPPFGKMNLVGLIYVLTMRRRIAYWNLDPQDFRRETGEEIVSMVARDLAPGSVVLLHDGTTNLEPESGLPVVVQALRGILAHAAESGIAFATVGSVLDEKIRRTDASKQLT